MRNNSSNTLEKKSYEKAKRTRNLARHSLFDQNRGNINLPSYLTDYDSSTRAILMESLTAPIPDPLPPLNLLTISYYRRSCRPVFLTKIGGEEEKTCMLDPHMTYESLWILAGVHDIEELPNYQQIVKEFQEELPVYLKSPYPEIKEIAVIAAGNRIIGRPEDILSMVKED